MKKTFLNFSKLAFALVLSLVVFSCDDDKGAEELFNQTPTERINEQTEELKNLLTSSENGWKTTYFTDDSQLGGFSFVFKFTEDNKVTMVSDFSDDSDDPETSTYNIVVGSTVKLSFDSKNYIHDLSDSDNFPTADLRGQGYRGDFEFLYYGQDGEDLIFESDRYHVKIRFTKATVDDIENIDENRDIIPVLNQSVYSRLITNNNGDTETFDFSYSRNTRYANVTNPDVFNRDISFGVGYEPNAINIRPAIEVGDQEITHLTYDATNNEFVSSTDANPAVKIIFSDEPFNLDDDYLDFENFAQYGYIGDFTGATDTPPTSGEFLDLFKAAQDELFDNENVYFSRLYLTVDAQDPYLLFVMEDEAGNDVTAALFLSYNIDNANKKIIMQSISWNDDTYESYLQPLVDMFVQNEGIYVDNLERTFQGFPKYTFTSAASPNLRVTMLAFQ